MGGQGAHGAGRPANRRRRHGGGHHAADPGGGGHRRPQAGLPQRTLGGPASDDSGCPATATAMPYFQWDNRGDGAMRVWMPLRDRRSASGSV
ncbi:hypothetical protein ACIBLA_20025 [Streptomyces sp. NPDC050433]|uniref:hypothetical protein n=1 Tax=Streptomyces sp. NPDC050433 TaxID=3365615 RepID=UPI00379F78BA